MIKFTNVSYKYETGVHALHKINLEIKEGEFVYITGTTGSGKSTLIRLLDAEKIPTKGSVVVAGVNVGKLKYSKVPFYRRKIGVVFQDYKLLEKKSAAENIAYAMEVVDAPQEEIKKRVKEVLKLVELNAQQAKARPKQLSGGQQQRVAIARAIVNKPKILIADEPTGSLDPVITNEIIKLFEKINKEEGTTIIIVTHNALTVRNHPKRTIILEEGYIVKDEFGARIDRIEQQEMEEMTRELNLKSFHFDETPKRRSDK